MADGFHPLGFGTIMMFGSLEFMSLGSSYDMVLLPPCGDAEPCPEPIPQQSVRGRRSGHHAGGARRGRQRSRISDPTTEARARLALPPIFLTRSPTAPAQRALEEGPAEHQARLLGPTGDRHDLLFGPDQWGRHGSRPLPKRGTKGPHHLVPLHLRMEERQRHFPSSLLGSGTQPPPTPLP